jgi:HEAT repeat protein
MALAVPPGIPAVVRCSHCAECYWLDEAKQIGTVEWLRRKDRRIKRGWRTAPKVKEPTEDEYYQAVERNLAKDEQQERNLRILAWWRHNDALRHSKAAALAGSDAWKENLKALARLLDDGNENDCLMKAELYRELGEFEPAKELLRRVISEGFRDAVRQLRDLCIRCDTRVRRLTFAESQDVGALVEMVRNRHGESRLPAIYALGNIGPDAKAAIPVLVEALRDSNVETAFRAMDALCEIGGWIENAFPVLVDLLNDKRYMIRGMAAKFLSKSGSCAKPAIPALRRALNDESCYVRHYAEHALQSLEAL